MGTSSILPGWMKFWFLSSAVIQAWDASFIFLRPHSLPGGKFHTLWKPYSLYIDIDLRYKDMDDSFGLAQSLLNYGEVVLLLVALFMNYRNHACTLVTSFTVCTMTFWKTTLYFTMYLPFIGDPSMIGTSDSFKQLFLFYLPNGVWLLVPALCLVYLGDKLATLCQHGTQTERKKKKR
ncbi:uncharacterized protein LOC144364063 [Saccoglossus kowalevskii]